MTEAGPRQSVARRRRENEPGGGQQHSHKVKVTPREATLPAKFARAMHRDGVSENLIAVRLRADVGDARPAADAVAQSAPGRSRGRDTGVGAESQRVAPHTGGSAASRCD